MSNHGKGTLGSICRDGGLFVKSANVLREEVTDRLFAGGPQGTVQLDTEELLGSSGLGLQPDAVAVGELNDQACEFKEGVGLGT